MIFAVIGALIWSGINPTDRLTWALEVFPTVLGLPILIWCDRHFGISKLFFTIFSIHMIILCVGGHYTYAEVPLGFWLQEALNLNRNHYDRLGHFFQGISPALISFEYFRRNNIVSSNVWLKVIAVCCALAFSSLYEMFEWWSAIAYGAAADAFLGTQGDQWDTQWDMFMALCGATSAMCLVTLIARRKRASD